MDNPIVITVNSRYYSIFKNIFLKSFIKFYPEYLKNLIVFVDPKTTDMQEYINDSETYKFQINSTPNESTANFKEYIHKSICFTKVIHIDDDIEFTRPRLFELFKKLFKEHSIVGEGYQSTNGECLSSWMFGVNNILIPKPNHKAYTHHDGLDTDFIQDQFSDKIYFFNKEVEKKTSHHSIPLPKNGAVTKYYIHHGGKSTDLFSASAKQKND